jgi:hypothetical protein
MALWQNTWDKQLIRRKGAFGLKVQRFQSLVSWLHYFWACMEVAQHGGEQGREVSSLHGSWEAKGEGRARVPACPPVTSLPSTRPHLFKVPLPPNSTVGWGPSLRHMDLWETLPNQSKWLGKLLAKYCWMKKRKLQDIVSVMIEILWKQEVLKTSVYMCVWLKRF